MALSIFPGVVWMVSEIERWEEKVGRYLGVVVAFEKMGYANKADVVIPHHRPCLLFAWDLEGILEDCTISVRPLRLNPETYLRNFPAQSAPEKTSCRCYKECVLGTQQSSPWDGFGIHGAI